VNFQPLPLLGNPHVQTILGNLLTGRSRTSRARRSTVGLQDGDRIALHETLPRGRLEAGTAPVALLLHGLGGSHQSAYMVRMMSRLNELGWRVFRMDLRGAGVGVRLARRLYNAGCSDDLRQVVEHIAAANPDTPLAVVGFSLGGNIVLKFAGELGERTPANLRAVAAIAPPVDLVRCSELIAKYPLYDAFYVRHLTQQVARHEVLFPDLPRIVFPRRMILRTFDELYTAPRWGYADALEYYGKASSLPLIASIRVPTFVLTARDDPFVAVEPFEALAPTPSLTLHIAAHGGHMGFLGFDGVSGVRWAETQVVDWLQRVTIR
jgi:predicted alpha/beta-fold hydrolase